MQTATIDSARYGRCLSLSKKVNWDIDADVIRFRTLDTQHKYLPDALSLAHELKCLTPDQQRFMSQVQGRTYAYMFGLVERYINAKILELSSEHALGDQTALAAMVQFSQEEIKHQELFRRVEKLAAATLPDGYQATANPDEIARAVLSKSNWAVLALTCHIEIFSQVHYVKSIKDDDNLSPLFKDVFHYHWLEEAQHATLDELEWQRVHDAMTPEAIDAAVDDLIELVGAVDGVLQIQAAADADYFCANAGGEFSIERRNGILAGILKAYRWQYIVCGVQVERFQKALASKVTPAQMERIQSALAPLMQHVLN